MWRTYRLIMRPTPRPQSDNTVVARQMEDIWFDDCWPPGTRDDYLWVRAVLVKKERT